MELIVARRELSAEAIQTISDGRILTGVSAQKLNLVDALGNRNSARAWLEQEKGIDGDIPLVDVSLKEPEGVFEKMMYGLKSLLFSKQEWQGIMARM